MKTPRWIEQPRMLAVLTLAFALVPAGLAYVSFQAARERDAQLFETAAEVLGEQFKLATFKEVTFLTALRNQWRFIEDKAHPDASRLPPAGWLQRHPHLLASAYANHETEKSIRVTWQDGKIPQTSIGANLAEDGKLAALLEKARLGPPASAFSAVIEGEKLAVAAAVPDAEDLRIVRGYIIGWLDLKHLCADKSLPLIADQALVAAASGNEGRAFEIGGEGEVNWTAWITRGPGFSREYGTPTSWLGFVALGLSVLPLSVLVMLASRAGKLRAALEAEQLKNQFVSTVSHEFRTPLSVILSGAELLEAHAASLSETRRLELLTQIKASTNRMNDMVEQVLLLGRIESGALKPNPQPVDVTALCREIVQEVQTATNHRCEIEMKLEVGMRELDASLLRSVLTNLLSNAVKYSKQGGIVILGVQDLGDLLRFLVVDEGIGIPKADQATIGNPFHRASNVGDIAGTGLGLTVVKRCVQLCGGEFSFWSEEGQGTHVSIFLRL
jgi:signal transduction histidine kinase